MATDEQSPVIVVGYDGSPTAREAVDYAARRAGSRGKVYVVYAYGPPPDWLGFPNYNRLLADSQARGRAELDALVMGDGALVDTDFETELLEAPPADAILRVAEARDADEIVVGSRGHGRIRSALGSVSHAVVHGAQRPTVVVPPPAG
jgi:nucleotide-binding universal stress UspA family protein